MSTSERRARARASARPPGFAENRGVTHFLFRAIARHHSDVPSLSTRQFAQRNPRCADGSILTTSAPKYASTHPANGLRDELPHLQHTNPREGTRRLRRGGHRGARGSGAGNDGSARRAAGAVPPRFIGFDRAGSRGPGAGPPVRFRLDSRISTGGAVRHGAHGDARGSGAEDHRVARRTPGRPTHTRFIAGPPAVRTRTEPPGAASDRTRPCTPRARPGRAARIRGRGRRRPRASRPARIRRRPPPRARPRPAHRAGASRESVTWPRWQPANPAPLARRAGDPSILQKRHRRVRLPGKSGNRDARAPGLERERNLRADRHEQRHRSVVPQPVSEEDDGRDPPPRRRAAAPAGGRGPPRRAGRWDR